MLGAFVPVLNTPSFLLPFVMLEYVFVLVQLLRCCTAVAYLCLNLTKVFKASSTLTKLRYL